MVDHHQNESHGQSLLHVHHEGESHRHGFHPIQFLKITWRSSCVASSYVNLLWPFVPLAIILNFVLPSSPLVVFGISYIGMIPAANLVGFAGQEIARKMPKVAGILIETFAGGIVEIVLFLILVVKTSDDAEGSGEEGNLVPVIQAAILGSILTNLLLCLGLCFYVGGLRVHKGQFDAAVSEVGTGLLLVAGFGLAIPSAFYSALKNETVSVKAGDFFVQVEKFTREKLQADIMRISQITSVVLIIAFLIYLFFNARSQHTLFDSILAAEEHADLDRESDLSKPKFTYTEGLFAITVALAFVTILAYFLVERIEDVVASGVPDQFLGLILLPLVEKAAEHLTAVDEAWDGQMNFALYHCLGPSIQTALLNAPLTVLVGWALGKPMDLNFEIFMVGLLVLSIIVVGNFLRDKESNYLEGALLVIVYIIIAIAAWYYPNPDVATSNGLEGGPSLLQSLVVQG